MNIHEHYFWIVNVAGFTNDTVFDVHSKLCVHQ